MSQVLPRIRTSDRREASLVDAPPGWLAGATLARAAPPSGATLDAAFAFVHGYTWLKDDPGPAELHRAMTVAAYKRNLAVFKLLIGSEDPQKTPVVDMGASILAKLARGTVAYAQLLSGSPEREYAGLLQFLVPDKWPTPLPTMDHLLAGYASLEASYRFELGREPETWTWLDKWNRALYVDPIAQTLATGQDSPTRKRARGLLSPKSNELTQNPLIDAFLAAWRKTNELRAMYVTDTGSAARKARERRDLLARDVLTLVLADPVREIFDAIGLWPALQYCVYVEAWWLYIEQLAVRCALPLDEVHYSLNSTVAVAMLEAMTGNALPAPGHSSYIEARRHATQKEDESRAARIEDLPIWGALTTDPTWAELWTLGMEGLKRPFILRSSLAKLESSGIRPDAETPPSRSEVAMDAWELAQHWPRYPETHRLPAITNDAWDPTGERFPIYKHSRCTAQLKLFVAASIAELAVTELGLPAPLLKLVDDTFNRTQAKHIKIHWDRSDDPGRLPAALEEAVPLLEMATAETARENSLTPEDVRTLNQDRARYLAALATRTTSGLVSPLRLVAGSLPWGGRKPPHITHRDGLTFDLQMGADSQKWPLIDPTVTKHLEGAVNISWPVILRVLARSNRADTLAASTMTYAPGEGRKRKRMTLSEVQSAYPQAVSKYQRVLALLYDPPTFPLPLSAAGRKATTRLAVQLHRSGKSAEARAVYDLAVITTLGEKIARRAVADPLILRHSSSEDGAFTGENRQLLFRGLVTDVMVQPMLARIEAIIRNTLLRGADKPGTGVAAAQDALMKGYEPNLDAESEWEKIERRFEDLPLAHSEAGVQRGLIATVALLLSGMRTLVFGSPALYARAMRILVDAASGDLAIANALLCCAGRVAEGNFAPTEFAFMPHNHSDHHHVQFGVQGYGDMYARGPTDWGLAAELADLERTLPVWLDLGIDLQRFRAYLDEQAKASTDGMPKAMSDERDAVMTLVSLYVSDFKQRYLLHRTGNPDDAENAMGYGRFAVARGRLYTLLMRANESSLYAGKPHVARGRELVALSEASVEVMRALKAAIDFRATKEYLDEARKRGLAVTVGGLECWEDETLTDVAKSLQGPDRFRRRLHEVIDFTVAPPPPKPDDDETDVTPEEGESNVSSEFAEEEEFRRAVFQELVERRVPAEP